MRIGIPKETYPGETRVALIPGNLSALTRDKHEVLLETGAGLGASYSDDEFKALGAVIVGSARALYEQSDIIFKVQPPTVQEDKMIREGSSYIGYLAPLTKLDIVNILTTRRVTTFSMEYIPRITRAQSMDALSSMATV